MEPKSLNPLHSPSLRNWGDPPNAEQFGLQQSNAYVDCGWGRLLFGHTFEDNATLAELLRDEQHGKRDIALYLRDPHVVLSQSPQELFLDPSHTFRYWLNQMLPESPEKVGLCIRPAQLPEDLGSINRIYQSHGMVPVEASFFEQNEVDKVTYFVACLEGSDEVLGSVIGVDHVQVFQDPENGCSLWGLAVDPQAPIPGIGRALVLYLLQHYQRLGRDFLDLSVMHFNQEAIRLYEQLGFVRVPVFSLKRKNAINEKLYIGPETHEASALNPYSLILIHEARRRGIGVRVLDAENNYFQLYHGGRTINCRESLTELTSAIAMSRCADKAVTSALASQLGLRVPAQRLAGLDEDDFRFLQQYRPLAVKPCAGEQGKGISLGVQSSEELELAIRQAQFQGDRVLLEEMVQGEDLRIVVIAYEVVAAAVRKPATIVGNGFLSIRQLIEKQSRRRAAATGNESRIPLDRETEKCVHAAGYSLEDCLPSGITLQVRRTANLHTGGTIHDVTDELHPDLAEAAIQLARALEIPVVGVDLMVVTPSQPEYYFIEANERPGLANHEPQPTAERFIDLLFPHTVFPKPSSENADA